MKILFTLFLFLFSSSFVYAKTKWTLLIDSDCRQLISFSNFSLGECLYLSEKNTFTIPPIREYDNNHLLVKGKIRKNNKIAATTVQGAFRYKGEKYIISKNSYINLIPIIKDNYKNSELIKAEFQRFNDLKCKLNYYEKLKLNNPPPRKKVN